MGLTRVARRAGIQTARSATALSRIGVTTNAAGSMAFTPNRNPVRNLVSQKAPPIPMTSPIPQAASPDESPYCECWKRRAQSHPDAEFLGSLLDRVSH